MVDEQVKFLKALSECYGIIVQACAMTKTPRHCYYKWRKEKEFKDASDEVILNQKEWVESKLLESISANDTTAIIFYLKTKGKDLGYADKIMGNIKKVKNKGKKNKKRQENAGFSQK